MDSWGPWAAYTAAAILLTAPHLWLVGVLERKKRASRAMLAYWVAQFAIVSVALVVAAYRLGGTAPAWAVYLSLGAVAIVGAIRARAAFSP